MYESVQHEHTWYDIPLYSCIDTHSHTSTSVLVIFFSQEAIQISGFVDRPTRTLNVRDVSLCEITHTPTYA